MNSKNCECQCGGTAEANFTELAPVLEKYAKVPGSLITILQQAQDIYGYLSMDAINYESIRSDVEDIDQAETIMNYKYCQSIFEQALASGAQIIQPTLMDFLR